MWNTIAIGILQVAAVLLVHRQGIYYMILTYACINIVWLLVWHHFIRREIGLRLWDAIKDIAPFGGIALLTMGITYALTVSIEPQWLLMTAKIIIAGIVYFCIMHLSRSKIQQEALSYLLRRKKEKP